MRRKTLLIGWDAADWKVINPLIEAGQMPNVQRLVRHGASGRISTLHPPLSPMLWTSIATGKRPFKHGIHGFAEPTPDGRGIQPVSNLSRTCKAVWNILNQNDLRSIVIGWWPSHPAEPIDGVSVSDHYHRASGPPDSHWPLLPNSVNPPELADTLAALRIHPDLLTPEMVEQFIPRARQVDQDKDRRMSSCMKTLAECMSVQAAALYLIDSRPWDFFAVYFDAIDHFSHGFMRYHPPRRPWIHPRDFELYSNVVAEAYRFHDRMLGDLLSRAGKDPTVILLSDHGFHPDHLRPAAIPDIPAGPAIEHSKYGILAISGPGIRQDAPLYGASVLDIAPTVLAMFGLPAGQDMDGQVLSQTFERPVDIASIPSWEDVPGRDGRHPSHTPHPPVDSLSTPQVDSHEVMEQMIALGYIERPDQNSGVAVEKTIRELRYNLGEAYQDAHRHLEAFEIFRELNAADPDDQRFAVRLFTAAQALGDRAEMRRVVEDADNGRRARFQPIVVDYLKARLFTDEKRYAEALESLSRVTAAHTVQPALILPLADLCLKLRRFEDAEQGYRTALTMDADNTKACLGLSRIALRRRSFDEAAGHALDALQRDARDPMAHYLLGLALAGQQDVERAADALRTAIALNPNFPQAHRCLASVLDKRSDEQAAASEHRHLSRRMQARSRSTELPPVAECLVIVTGLPRSGTSLLMQMLAAGGFPILSDGQREADEDNPKGYLEFEPVKSLFKDAAWLRNVRGKAVKIVAPLLSALPLDLPCRVIFCERDLDEVLDSQERMLRRPEENERRATLKQEYIRTLASTKAMLSRRSRTGILTVQHARAMADSASLAETLNRFLGTALDTAKMAAAVDPTLHRNRR